MIKAIKEFTTAEASRMCLERQKRASNGLYNKCVGCPAAIQYGTSNLTLCYFIAKNSLLRNADNEADDGSIADEDIPYWAK